MSTLQYQSLADPLQPDPEAIEDLRWMQPPSEPVRKVPPRQEGGAVGIMHFTGNAAIPDTWVVQASEPVRQRPPGPKESFFGVFEPDLLTIPTMDTWYKLHDPPEPLPKPRWTGGWEGIVEDTITTPQPEGIGWYRQPEEPQRHTPPRPHGGWVGVLERTLHEVPPLDTWYQRPTEPQRRVQLALPGVLVVNLEPSVIEEPLLSMWWQQASEPARLRDRPRPQWPSLFFQGDPGDFDDLVEACPYTPARPDEECDYHPARPDVCK